MAPSTQAWFTTFDDDDHSTGMSTPATTIAETRELFERSLKSEASVPCRGKTFTIREARSGHVLTLFDGNICLLPAETLGSAIHWRCHENDGWLGFKNLASGQYLGFDGTGCLRTMPHHQAWEYIDLRPVKEGGYVLLMQDAWLKKLWPVKIRVIEGVQRLAREDAPVDQGVRWEFFQA